MSNRVCPWCKRLVPMKQWASHFNMHRRKGETAFVLPPIDEEDRPLFGGLRLDSKRGSLVTMPGQCAECGGHRSRLWYYQKSNRGPVFICARCKPGVFDRSHGRVDAWRTVVQRERGPGPEDQPLA